MQKELLTLEIVLVLACELGCRSSFDCKDAVDIMSSDNDINNHLLRNVILIINVLLTRNWNASAKHIREHNIVEDVVTYQASRDGSPMHFSKFSYSSVSSFLCQELLR